MAKKSIKMGQKENRNIKRKKRKKIEKGWLEASIGSYIKSLDNLMVPL